MSEPALTTYRMDKFEKAQEEFKVVLVEHIEDDHEVQSQIKSTLLLINHRLTAIEDSVAKLSTKTSSNGDWINKVIGACLLIGFLVTVYKYIGL